MDTESRPVGPDEHKARARSLFVPGETDRFGRQASARIEDVTALTPENDPYFAGRDRDWKWARWFAELWEQHGPAEGVRNHLRRFHYRLFTLNAPLADGSPYTADPDRSWVQLNNAARWARYLGLVDPDRLDDRRNPGLVEFAPSPEDDPEVELKGETWTELPGVELPDLRIRLPRLDPPGEQEPEVTLPGVRVTGYHGGTAAQPVLLEVWIEKSTMDDVLVPGCRELGVNLVRGQGFLSVTNVCMLLRRAEAAGRDCHVLYVSDYDLSGTSMPRSVARQLEFWRERLGIEVIVTLEPVALTAGQVERYGLPQAPDSGSVELDALEAIVPGELADLVRQAVAGWRDPALDEELGDAQWQAGDDAEAQWDEKLRDIREHAEDVMARYREHETRFREAATRFTREAADLIAPLRKQAAAVNRAISELAGRYAPDEALAMRAIGELDAELEDLADRVRETFESVAWDLPEVPRGEVDPARYEAALLDSRRGWLDQLNRYRQQKGLAFLQVNDGDGRPGRAPVPTVTPPPGPDRDALAVALRAGQWTRAEIAELFGCSPANIGNMLARTARHPGDEDE